MDCVYPWEIRFILNMQDMGDWLTFVMKGITQSGNPGVYVIIIAVIYWCFDRKWGLKLAIFLPVVLLLNSILKQAFKGPRPFWVDPDIKALRVSNGFGMPSGHAQASPFWLYTGSYLHSSSAGSCQNRWLIWVFVIALTILVGFSRVYLGAHSLLQVLVGWGIGLIVLIPFCLYERRIIKKVLDWFLRQCFIFQLLWIIGITLFFLVLGMVFVYLPDWVMPVDWIRNAADDLACTDKSIFHSHGMSDIAGSAGAFLGVTLGALCSRRSCGFDAGGKAVKRWLRGLFGGLCIVVLFSVFICVEPDKARDGLHSTWSFFGSFLLLLTIIYLLPLLFKKFNLCSADPSLI